MTFSAYLESNSGQASQGQKFIDFDPDLDGGHRSHF